MRHIITFFLFVRGCVHQMLHIPMARAYNTESLTVVLGKCVATFVAKTGTDAGTSIAFGGDTFYNEDDLLGDPTMDGDRGKRHMAADASRSVTVLSMSRAGTREIKFLLGDNLDRLKHWGQAKIQTFFDFDFFYTYDSPTKAGARLHRHKNCFFTKMPLAGVGRDRGYIVAEISYEDLAEVDPATDKEI
jgi:hypothetical protein